MSCQPLFSQRSCEEVNKAYIQMPNKRLDSKMRTEWDKKLLKFKPAYMDSEASEEELDIRRSDGPQICPNNAMLCKRSGCVCRFSDWWYGSAHNSTVSPGRGRTSCWLCQMSERSCQLPGRSCKIWGQIGVQSRETTDGRLEELVVDWLIQELIEALIYIRMVWLKKNSVDR